MGFISSLGRRHASLVKLWTPTAATFGATSGLALLYFTDWKMFVRYIPFYGGKFKEEDALEEAKKKK